MKVRAWYWYTLVLVLLLVGCTLTPITPTPPDATQTEHPNTEVPTVTATATVDTVYTPTPEATSTWFTDTPTPEVGPETATPFPTLAGFDWWFQVDVDVLFVRSGPGKLWPCVMEDDTEQCFQVHRGDVLHVENVIPNDDGTIWLEFVEGGSFVAYQHPDCAPRPHNYCGHEVFP